MPSVPSFSALRTAGTPVVALVLLALVWGRALAPWAVPVVALALVGAVLVAVHHAEVVAHRVGEPFGSLILAVAVTVIEVGLTIPAIALASIWMDGPLLLGLSGTELVLLALTALIGTLTVGLGSAIVLQGAVHLVIFAAFLFVALAP